jgi:hypothetical protein
MEIELFQPRPQQLDILKQLQTHRFGVLVCHRRFGKTVLGSCWLILKALACQDVSPQVAYISPTYREAKRVAWDYVKRYAGQIPRTSFNEAELRCDLPGNRRIYLLGADNPDALRGLYFDAVVLDEYEMMQGRVWTQVVMPALADRKGQALFLGTPNGRNQFYDLRNQAQQDDTGAWFVATHKASETHIIEYAELESQRKHMLPEEYAQEFECSFEASVRGAIYAAELGKAREDGRIGHVPHDPSTQVHTAWDIGFGDATAIWFYQQRLGAIRIIDYYEAEREGMDHYAGILKGKPYNYGRHWGPHDIQSGEFGSGLTRAQTAGRLGITFSPVPRIGSGAEGAREERIHAARMILPRCEFDEKNCAAGLEALLNYRRDYNERMGEFKAQPVHDWASNGADAFGHLAISIVEAPQTKRPVERKIEQQVGGWMQ